MLGFILVSAVVGPHRLGALRADYPWLAPFTIGGMIGISAVAEMGVALPLFTIGLELSFERLRTMRHLVLGLGTARCALSAARIAARLYAAGASDAVPETVEARLQLFEAVPMDIGGKAGPVIAAVHAKREEIQQDPRKMLPGDAPAPTLGRRHATVRNAAPTGEG